MSCKSHLVQIKSSQLCALQSLTLLEVTAKASLRRDQTTVTIDRSTRNAWQLITATVSQASEGYKMQRISSSDRFYGYGVHIRV